MEIVTQNKLNTGKKLPKVLLASLVANTHGLITDTHSYASFNGQTTEVYKSSLLTTRNEFITSFLKNVFGLEELFTKEALAVGDFTNQINIHREIISIGSAFDPNATNNIVALTKNRVEFVQAYGKIKQRYIDNFTKHAEAHLSKNDDLFNSLEDSGKREKIKNYRKETENKMKEIFIGNNTPVETLQATAKQFADMFKSQGIDRATILADSKLLVKVLDFISENYLPYSVSLVAIIESLNETTGLNLDVFKKEGKSNYITFELSNS